jgi:hypothetical protein
MRARTRARRAGLLGFVCLLGLALASPAVARADGLPIVDLTSDPWYVNWTSLLPPAYLGVDTDSADICVAGTIKCVDRVQQKLESQLARLGCDHNAVFSLAYARTTEAVGDVERADPGFFADTPWLNHYDAVFADMYFDAWNAWQKRQPGVPDAWAMAFDSADHRKVSGAGNLLLGMSAHVNRDLPFTLYAIGLVAPDGTSRKADHDKVNEILNMIITPLLDEVAAKYDPSVRVVPGIGSVGDFLEFQALPTWREQAWRNAELLATAPNAAARAVIAADIERSAATEANLLIALTQYLPPITSAASRDAFCAAHVS